jgi:O-antigen/teichoic acid export membrane protein
MIRSAQKPDVIKSSNYSFLKGASVYFTFNIFSALLQFVSIPIFARLMSPDGFGMFGACFAALAILSPLVSFGGGGFVGLPIFRGKNPDTYITTSLQFIILAFIVLSLLASSLSQDVISIFSVERSTLFIAIGISSAQAVNSIYLGVELANKRSTKNAITSFAITALSILFGIVGLMMQNASWINRVFGVLLAQTVVMTWSLYRLCKEYKLNLFALDKSVFRHLFAYSTPLLPHFFAGPIFSSLDRLILLPKIGAYSTGIYAAAFTISSALEAIFMSANSALVPHIASEIRCEDQLSARRRLVALTRQLSISIVVLCITASISFSLLSPIIFGPEYAGINEYILPFAIASCFSGFYYLFVNYLFLFERTAQISLATMSVALLKIFLLWTIIPTYGAVGAAYITAVSNLILCTVVVFFSQKAYRLTREFNRYAD